MDPYFTRCEMLTTLSRIKIQQINVLGYELTNTPPYIYIYILMCIYIYVRMYTYIYVYICFFIIKGFRTIVFIFIVISTTYWLSSGVCRTREPTWNFELRLLMNPRRSPVLIPLAISRVQVLSIPVLLLACSQD